MNDSNFDSVVLRDNEQIPRIVHYCWFGENPLPPLAIKCLRSWKKYLPEYQFICWNESSFDINQHPYTKEAYESKKWAFVTDYIRLYALERFGGIYMDTDVELVKSLDPLMNNPAFTCFEPENFIHPEKIYIQTGLLAAKKNSIWIKKMLEYYEERHFLDEFGLPKLIPNPVPLTEITVREFGLKLNHAHQVLDNILIIYPKEYFCPINWFNRKIITTPNTYAIHHFAGSWIESHGNKKNIVIRKKVGLFLKTVLGQRIYNYIGDIVWRKKA